EERERKQYEDERNSRGAAARALMRPERTCCKAERACHELCAAHYIRYGLDMDRMYRKEKRTGERGRRAEPRDQEREQRDARESMPHGVECMKPHRAAVG